MQAALSPFRLLIVAAVCSAAWSAPHSASAQDVGVAAAVNTQATGTAPGRRAATIVLGDNIIYRERIRTSASGLVQVLLNDGSTFTVGANSDLVIDEFVYDPNAGSGRLVISLSKGVARFVGGKLSKNPDGVTVNTPVGTLGIRGGIANINLDGNEGVFSLLYGDEIVFTGQDGTRKRVYEPGYSVSSSNGLEHRIRRTNPADIGRVNDSIAGRVGQFGGAPRVPNNRDIARSLLPRVNSDLGVALTAPPRPPEAVRSTPLRNVGPALIQPNRLEQQRLRNELEGPPPDMPDYPDLPDEPEVVPQ
ncbi:FecR family protein [Roseibium hamelinense]|uniref:FecR family protein n=1 Tax=Roseibium hamelinense TaxID=150831 RepID=A0A562SVD0_9HYPH|nr:FecR family protein [Roseibium hamelinense]MTI42124.1 hypothetical protein [Roseibium hamelinense]TWI84726.1 FecR family protein [Roseibium hamelinense]